MEILIWTLIGLSTGTFISLFLEDQIGKNLFFDIFLGVMGAYIGGFVVSIFIGRGPIVFEKYDLYTLITTFVVATVIIWLGHLWKQIV